MTHPVQQHQIISASAGTGKTYRLAMRFIALLAQGEAPQSLLATTFTRKAAGEMLERVLKFLAEGATAPSPRGTPRLLSLQTDAHPDLTAAACARHLRHVVDAFGTLKIQTLDALLQRVASSASLTLGLPPSWTLLEDADTADLTLSTLSDLLHRQRADTATMLAQLHALNSKGPASSVHRPILGIVHRATAAYIDGNQRIEPWQHIAPRSAPLNRDQLASLQYELERKPGLVPVNKDGSPAKQFAQGLAKLVSRLAERDWDGLASNGLLTHLDSASPSYHSKPIPPALITLLTPLLTHIQSTLRQQLHDNNLSAHAIVSAFDREIMAAKLAAANLTFADVPRLLLDSHYAGVLDHTYYSLDAQIRHILLDEFQDTSRDQYLLLKPLLDEAVSSDDARTVFFVGDSKQALYGWRGGAPELLDSLAAGHIYPGIPTHALNINYRSGKEILSLVNTLFTDLSSSAAFTKHPEAPTSWQPRFATHHPHPGAPDGSVTIRVADVPNLDESETDALARTTAERIAELHTQFPHATIAVLVRNKSRFPRLRYELSLRNIESSQEGVARLIDSPAVAAVLSLLHLIAHPADTAARYHVATSPLGPILKFTDYRDSHAARRLSLRARRTIRRRTLPRVLAKLTRLLTPFTDIRGTQRLARLTELATGDATPLDLDAFVRRARAHTLHDTSDVRVRLMTVHNAKGLEFDIVLLPDVHRAWTQPAPAIITQRPKPLESLTIASLAPGASLRNIDPEIQALYQSNLDRKITEELSVLYVALTRPIHHLEIILPGRRAKPQSKPDADSGSNPSCSALGLITAAFNLTSQLSFPDDWLPGEHSLGRIIHSRGTPSIPTFAHAPSPAPRKLTLTLAPADATRPAARRRVSPSGLEGGFTITLSDLIAPTSESHSSAVSTALLRGRALHALFELIEWSDTMESIPEHSLAAALAALQVPAELHTPFITDFHAVLAHSHVRALLARPTECATPLLRREWAFTCPTTLPDGQLVILDGRFDRVHIHLDAAGNPIAAHIIDFKTDAPHSTGGTSPSTSSCTAPSTSASPHADRILHYTPQIQAYAAALSTLLNLPLSSISCSLLFTATATIAPIPTS